MNPTNKRRQINNELAARRMNQRVKQSIEAHTPAEEQDKIIIDFHCECADGNCKERVGLTLDNYHQLHRNSDEFVILKGHVAPVVEKIVKREADYQVVKKYAL